jgi:hypothetical protein
VHWEPCHGPFFVGYPWYRYDDITDYLRYTLYDVIALDSCLRANIQAPKHLRELFAKVCPLFLSHCCVRLGCSSMLIRGHGGYIGFRRQFKKRFSEVTGKPSIPCSCVSGPLNPIPTLGVLCLSPHYLLLIEVWPFICQHD